MAASAEMMQAANSSHRWSFTMYDDEKPLQRCPVQHVVYEPSFDVRSLQFSRHRRRTVNEFSPFTSYFFCTHKERTGWAFVA